MSEPLKIGLVAEGPTDYEVIQAALKAVLPDPFIITLLQPEVVSRSATNFPFNRISTIPSQHNGLTGSNSVKNSYKLTFF